MTEQNEYININTLKAHINAYYASKTFLEHPSLRQGVTSQAIDQEFF